MLIKLVPRLYYSLFYSLVEGSLNYPFENPNKKFITLHIIEQK